MLNIEEKFPRHPDLNIKVFGQILDRKNLTNSYKLYWFASIFDEIIQGKKEITFQDIVIGMISKCWYSLLEYKLNLGKLDQLINIINVIFNKYGIKKEIHERDLKKEIKEILIDKDIVSEIEIIYKYVPYRLLTPFYDNEIKKYTEHKKHDAIVVLSQNENSSLYKIDKESKKIIIHPLWYEYIIANQTIIKGWIYYKLIDFLQSRNPNVPAIPFKLHAPQKRDLKDAIKFFNKILSIEKQFDIYSNKPLVFGSFAVDHFIPWSFVLHDRLWNLVPTIKTINSQKSNYLPARDYFNKFYKFQYSSYKAALNNNFDKKLLEDYLDISESLLDSCMPEPIFIKSLKNRIEPLYQLAENSGFKTEFFYQEHSGTASLAADDSSNNFK